MSLFAFLAVLLVLTAGFSYVNARLLHLPTTIGLMALTLLASLAVIAAGLLYPVIEQQATTFVRRIDFNQAVLHGMLGFLLFAGSLSVDLSDLARYKLVIGVLSTVGVLLSTAIVGSITWGLLTLVGLPMRPIWCFLFGALISPTDPIAVLALLRQLGAPKRWKSPSPGNRCSTTASVWWSF